MVSDQTQIKEEAEKYFKTFLTMMPKDQEVWPIEELRVLLEFCCTEEDKMMLIKEVTEVEVRKVLFSMHGNKFPSPDGFTSEFFKGSWSIVGIDVVVAVQSFSKMGFLPKGIKFDYSCKSFKRHSL